jgi:tripartite ATP-independent transporter DctP family solute receptor
MRIKPLTAILVLLLACTAATAKAAETVRLGIVTTPGTAQHITAARFKELVEDESGMSVKIFHSGSLGSETEILQQIQMNAVQMGIITLGPFDVFVPEVKVVNFPFMFKSHAQVDRILDGPLGQEVLRALEQAGFKGLAFSENGFRNLTNDLRPVRRAADAEGLKIRVMESRLHQELWRTLGANPTPMAWPIYSELQQGAIDGQENPLSVIWKYKLFEVQDHLTLTGHVYSAHICVANLEWFAALPVEQQTLLGSAMRRAARFQRLWNRNSNAEFLDKLKAAGMQVVEEPDLESFKDRAEGLKDMDIYSEPAVRELLERFLAATRN